MEVGKSERVISKQGAESAFYYIVFLRIIGSFGYDDRISQISGSPSEYFLGDALGFVCATHLTKLQGRSCQIGTILMALTRIP